MAQALCKGFLAAGLTKGDHVIASCHPADKQSATAFKGLGATSTHENVPVVEKSEIVIISVKPNIIPIALAEIQTAKIKADKLFLSIAMGVPIKHIEQHLPIAARVVRVMPNTPALVRCAASVFVCGSRATPKDATLTRMLLESVGSCEEVTENLLDPITALSGSGPAYVYVMIEALADGGVKMGLPRDMAYRLAAQTVLGAGKMVRETGTHPGILKDDVSSPAGSTTAGLHFLEKNGFRAAVIGAIESAANRCGEVTNESNEKQSKMSS